MNKIRFHLHMFTKIKLTHHYFKSSPYICSTWIGHVDFLYFFDLVRFTPAQLTSSPPFLLSGVASPPADVATPPRCVTLPSYGANTSSLLPLNLLVTLLHHRRWTPSSDRQPSTLHYYKKVFSTLATLPITQPCIYFASSLARASHHRSSTCRRRSLSPLSYIYRPSAQWHPQW
jgi:hypothetical protein